MEKLEFLYYLESDLFLLEALVGDVALYQEIYKSEQHDPEATIENEQNLQFALDQYKEHSKYLLPELEKYMQLCRDEEMVVDIGYFRVLKELRRLKAEGIF